MTEHRIRGGLRKTLPPLPRRCCPVGTVVCQGSCMYHVVRQAVAAGSPASCVLP